MTEYKTASEAQTAAAAAQICARLKPGAVVAFTGGMGMGKTAFVFTGAISLIKDGKKYTYDKYKKKVEQVGKGNRFCLRDFLPHGMLQTLDALDADKASFTLRTLSYGSLSVTLSQKMDFIERISFSETQEVCLGPGCYSGVPFSTTYEFSRSSSRSYALSPFELGFFESAGIL